MSCLSLPCPLSRAVLQSLLQVHYWFTVYCPSLFNIVAHGQRAESHRSLSEKSLDQLNHNGLGVTE